MSSFDGCRAVTPRGFVRFLGRSSVSRSRAIAATLCHLGCVFVRAGGSLVCLGGTIERLCSTNSRRLGGIGGGEGALGSLPVPMPGKKALFVRFGCARAGSLRSLPCLRSSCRGCRTRLRGEACAWFLDCSQPQTLDFDDVNTWRVNENDQGFRGSGQRPRLLAFPEILAWPLRAVWLNDPDWLSGMKLTLVAVCRFRCHGRQLAPSRLVGLRRG